MPRNMSFFHTQNQIKNKTKFVTRRLGWWFLVPGEKLNAVVKCQGVKKGEKVKRLAVIQVTDVNTQYLSDMTQKECLLEGFPNWTPKKFIDFFCAMNKCHPDTVVNRIEFEYLKGGK